MRLAPEGVPALPSNVLSRKKRAGSIAYYF
jgi:hypothetical protein